MFKKLLLIILFILLTSGCREIDIKAEDAEFVEVVIGGVTVRAEVARDEESQRRGLSGRDFLGENEGMLFVYDEAEIRGFWMKEMRFSLDIIFIDDDEVVDVVENLLPPKFGEMPASYTSKQLANYVLEVRAGLAREHGVEIGDEVDIRW